MAGNTIKTWTHWSIASFLIGISTFNAADPDFFQQLSDAAIDRTKQSVRYDGSYLSIDYPMGDVPSDIGVCSDVVIRSYRQLGVDLQEEVHKDMRDRFSDYPAKRVWGQSKSDTNIDHRRVLNLQVFFSRFGESLAITQISDDYQTGDIVTWMLPGNLPHIGIVTDQRDPITQRPLIAHNIGRGPELEDMLFSFEITGHYRYRSQNN